LEVIFGAAATAIASLLVTHRYGGSGGGLARSSELVIAFLGRLLNGVGGSQLAKGGGVPGSIQ